MEKQGFVYLLTNVTDAVIYTGVTSNLKKRVYEHKMKTVEGFTKKYNVNKLVYYEMFGNIQDAIARGKQIKAGSRAKKIALIKSKNPGFRDLYENI
jgi:putative endonuclease